MRHTYCSLLFITSLKSLKCLACKKYCESYRNQCKRLKLFKNIIRISSTGDHLYKLKLKAMQKKMKKKNKCCDRIKTRVQKLQEVIDKMKNQVASVSNDCFKNIPQNEQLVVKEIVNAARKTDPRGRRYTHEFIMLCMLLNIRSTSYYEFPRYQNILPLPCTRTIRDYISLISGKCGFDNDFFKLLQKLFNKKEDFYRHGVLLLDEINLRKLVTVSTKNLS